jgi:hypothetical protein
MLGGAWKLGCPYIEAEKIYKQLSPEDLRLAEKNIILEFFAMEKLFLGRRLANRRRAGV